MKTLNSSTSIYLYNTACFFRTPSTFNKLILISFLFILSLTTSAQTTIYKETIGTYVGSITVASYNGWAVPATTHTVPLGTTRVTSTVIPSDYAGASGGTPVKINGNSQWQISGINTFGRTNIKLSFGIHKSNSTHSGSGLIIEVSSNGTVFTPLAFTLLPVGNGTGDTWFYREGGVDVTGVIPAASNLRIRFRNTAVPTYDIDDIEITSSFALPLTLIDFNAEKLNNNTVLSWTTTDEVNVDHFEVEKSDDGISFSTMQNLPARNSGRTEKYTATDLNSGQKKSFYRLLSVDIDGKKNYSRILSINQNRSRNLISVSATTGNTINLLASNSSAGPLQYSIFDMNGQMIQKGNISLSTGLNRIDLNATAKHGVYLVHLVNQDIQEKLKAVIR